MIFSNILTDRPNFIFDQFSVARKLIILNDGAVRPIGLLFLFWHGASLGRYQCSVIRWIWLNHFKCHFFVRKVKFGLFLT